MTYNQDQDQDQTGVFVLPSGNGNGYSSNSNAEVGTHMWIYPANRTRCLLFLHCILYCVTGKYLSGIIDSIVSCQLGTRFFSWRPRGCWCWQFYIVLLQHPIQDQNDSWDLLCLWPSCLVLSLVYFKPFLCAWSTYTIPTCHCHGWHGHGLGGCCWLVWVIVDSDAGSRIDVLVFSTLTYWPWPYVACVSSLAVYFAIVFGAWCSISKNQLHLQPFFLLV
jgi:hypothetical protein